MTSRRMPFSHLLCCLLVSAFALLWLRSYFRGDIFAVFIGKKSHLQAVGSFEGRLTLMVGTIGASPARAWTWDHDSFRPVTYRAIEADLSSQLVDVHKMAGFGCGQTAPGSTYAADWSWRMYWLPHWLMVAIFAILPLCRAGRAIQWRRRARRGLCPDCGYDLRASPERCPECGASTRPSPQPSPGLPGEGARERMR